MTNRTLPTIEELRASLRPLDFFARYANGQEQGHTYVDAHVARFRESLDLLRVVPAGARILELGAVPYYMTILVTRYLDAAVDPLSFYEVGRARVPFHEVTSPVGGERHVFPYREINVEREHFPFADGGHDAVLCCELLEHLLINPSHMLFEAHRVLRPGGLLLVSTPNVLRRANVLALTRGENIYDRYHGNGVYGRHNREYTRAEVEMLLRACGFAVECAEARDVMPETKPAAPGTAEPGREDTLFVLARSTGVRRMACPETLYVLMDEYRNVTRTTLTMGVDEIGQIGPGWFEPEVDGERGCRWSRERATFFLPQKGERTIGMELCCHHPDVTSSPVAVTLLVDGQPAGQHTLSDHAWREVAFPLAPEALGATLECTLMVSRCWCPKDTGGEDTRQLGVRVSRITLY